MDMHLYQVKGGKNLPIARIAGSDSIGEAMVGKDPVEGVHLGDQEEVVGLSRRGPAAQLLHGLVFGAALGLLALASPSIFGLLGVMNFAHGELYMLGAYAGIAVIGLTHSFWAALVVAPLAVGAIAP